MGFRTLVETLSDNFSRRYRFKILMGWHCFLSIATHICGILRALDEMSNAAALRKNSNDHGVFFCVCIELATETTHRVNKIVSDSESLE